MLLVDDGVAQEMALGGFGTGLELLILLFLKSLQICTFTIYHLLVNVLRFLVSGFYVRSLCILVLVIGKLA